MFKGGYCQLPIYAWTIMGQGSFTHPLYQLIMRHSIGLWVNAKKQELVAYFTHTFCTSFGSLKRQNTLVSIMIVVSWASLTIGVIIQVLVMKAYSDAMYATRHSIKSIGSQSVTLTLFVCTIDE